MRFQSLSLMGFSLLAACSSNTALPTLTPTSATASLAAPSGQQAVVLNFAGEINGQPFRCGQRYGPVGTTASQVTPSDFRMYVSEVQLLTAEGQAVPVQLDQDQVWQHQSVSLIDFEDGSGACLNGTGGTNKAVRGSVPAGRYTGVRFTLGVPFSLNHGDPTVSPAPLNNTAMFWNWQGGYKFLKFDTTSSGISPEKPAAASAQGPVTRFSVHLGSTVCASASKTRAPSACQNPNRMAVEFKNFDLATHTVVADIGRVLTKANVDTNAAGTSPGCMSFPKDADCVPVMGALGLPYDGAPAQGAQQLFGMR